MKKENTRLKEIKDLQEFMVSTISHELKTPLISVLNAAQLLQMIGEKRDDRDSKSRKLGTLIIDGAHKMNHLIEDLIDTIRIDTQKLLVSIEENDLVSIIQNVIDSQTPFIRKSNHRIILNAPEYLDIECDGERISQVLSNILINAIKNTPNNGTITITVEKCENKALVSILDTGIGIDPVNLPKIFKKFSIFGKQPPNKSLNIKSTGLGLYIAKKIIEAHNGQIWADSEGRDKGAKFSFSIPIIQS